MSDTVDLYKISDQEFEVGLQDVVDGVPVDDLFVACGLCSSLSDARRIAKQGGLYVNGNSLPEDHSLSWKEFFSDGRLKESVTLARGKKQHAVLRIKRRDDRQECLVFSRSPVSGELVGAMVLGVNNGL